MLHEHISMVMVVNHRSNQQRKHCTGARSGILPEVFTCILRKDISYLLRDT